MKKYQIRKQITDALNFQYRTNKFTTYHSFHQLLQICKQSIISQTFYAKYQIDHSTATRYKINTTNIYETDKNQQPFEQQQQIFLHQLVQTCQLVIEQPQYQNLNTLNQFISEKKTQTLRLKKYYEDIRINFRFIGIKLAMIYVALSQCKIWYIVCRNRKKSGKGFELDPLIQVFNDIVKKFNLENPFHVSTLTKKAAKNIQKKQNIEKSNNPLFDAVSNSDCDLVKQLILKGAKIQKPSFYNRRHTVEMRCTHRACMNNDLKICKVLDSFGADWEAEDSQKMSPIFYAVQSGSLEIIKYLVQEIKVDIEKRQIQNRTPFYFACTQNNLDVINYLYKIGCNINHKSELGRTALSKACYLGRVDIVKFLLGCKQIDIYSQCRKGRTALHNAVFGPKGGRQGQKFGTNDKDSPQCAQILLQNGFQVDKVDNENNTPLHIAMSSQAIDSIRILLAFGASLSSLNKYGQTPLLTGAKFGHVQAVKILCQEYKTQILVKDIFNKNIVLLTAKFKQNGDDGTNPVFYYILETFIKKCKQQQNIKEIHYTFRQLLINQSPIQLEACWKMIQKYQIKLYDFGTEEIQKLLNLSINRRSVIETNLKYLKKEQKQAFKLEVEKQSNIAVQILRDAKINQEKLQEIYVWLISNNDSKLLEFILDSKILELDKVQLSSKKMFSMIENQSLQLKQKVISFCIISLNFNWITYRGSDGSNILHLLIRKQRGGCLMQLFKSLSGKIPTQMLTNKYLRTLQPKQKDKILQQLLCSKNQSGLNPHQLSLILKNKSIGKIIEQKLKQSHLQEIGQTLDIKDYQIIVETDPKQLEIFNDKLHEKEQELADFQYQIEEMPAQKIELNWKSPIIPINLPSSHQNFEIDMQNRKLLFISTAQELNKLQTLQSQIMIGIDLEYFNQEGVTIVSTVQLSSLQYDFIIDCLMIPLKTIREHLRELFHSKKTIKIMHGADNDLILIRSSFNLSLINFLDTSRIDLLLRNSKNDLRGLSTLCKEYLGISLSKEYQVSQWRIRPLPKAMLQYAKKDALILPYLLAEMFRRLQDIELIRQVVISGCRQVRRNKKNSQPLFAGIKSK